MTDIPDAQPANQFETIELDTPLKRGNKTIKDITLRRPKAGELRGLSMTDLLNLDVNATITLLPRISQPALTEAELRDMDASEIANLGGAVVDFLLPKRARRNG